MRFVVSVFGSAAIVLVGVLAIAAETKQASGEPKAAAKPTAASEARPADEKEIRQVVDTFVKSYNNHGAQAIATLFTPEGMTTDEEGNVTKGRKDIEQLFAGIFKEHPATKIENTIESVRFVGPAEAIEVGTTTITHDKDTPAEKSRYQVVHVKKDGKWQMASATDLPEDVWTGEDQLKQIEGLIGDWVDESPDALVLTSYRWDDNHRFILGQFTVQVAGKPAMTGTHRIGWDPLKKTIRSWVFDSEGGFAEGVWTHDGEEWVSKLTGVTRGGKPCSASYITIPLDKNRMTLQTVDRVIGEEKLPDGEKFLVVRRPPAPKALPAIPSAAKEEK
jgi:uncharacterized protein (TIGR02246 family)